VEGHHVSATKEGAPDAKQNKGRVIIRLYTNNIALKFTLLKQHINPFNPSAWGHLNPSSYCDVGRLFYGVFKLKHIYTQTVNRTTE